MRDRIKYKDRIYKEVSTKTGRHRKYSLETVAKAYSTEGNAAEVGRLLDLHHTTVLYALEQLGIKRGPRGGARYKSNTPLRLSRGVRDKRICEMYVEQGLSCPQVATAMNLTEEIVRYALHRMGAPVRKRGTRYQKRKVAPVSMFTEGFVDYSLYRKQYRETLKIEKMLAAQSKRKDWAA